jgi:SAM-dependent methyltransferase
MIVEALSTRMVCPACEAENPNDYRFYNQYLLKRCPRCKFIFTAQRSFSEKQYEDVYSGLTAYKMMIDDARQTYEGKKGYRDLWWFKRKALNWLRKRAPHGRLLDVGSGPGTLLMVANRNYGYEVQEIEPASAAAAIANQYGVPTYCGTVEEFQGGHPDKFNAITSFEVLEHVANPLSFLVAVRKLLKNGGVLLLSVPNTDDPYCLDQHIAPAMPPIHINFFSRRSLGFLLNRAGFSLQRAYTLPIPTSSVRNIVGVRGFLVRLPYLAAASVAGYADGTTLLTMATPCDDAC